MRIIVKFTLNFYIALSRFKENTSIPKEISSLIKRHPSAVADIPEAVNVSRLKNIDLWYTGDSIDFATSRPHLCRHFFATRDEVARRATRGEVVSDRLVSLAGT